MSVDPANPNTLEYESPRALAEPLPLECRRVVKGEHEWLVMVDGASTPDRCIHCNAPADGFRKRVTYPEPPGDGAVRHVGWTTYIFGVIMVVVALVQTMVMLGRIATRRNWAVHFAICRDCRNRTRRYRWTVVLIALLGLAVATAGILILSNEGPPDRHRSIGGPICVAAGFLLLIAAAFAISMSEMPQFDRIVNNQIWFKNVEKSFLDSLPMIESGKAKTRQ